MNLHNEPEHFKELIAVTAQSLSLPMIYIEKDYWVTLLLKNLSLSDYKNSLVFKGGTSLSKAYRLISRFSEDIDLAIGVEGLSEHKLKKLMKEAEQTITAGFTYTKQTGESKRGSIRKTYYHYPKLFDGEFGQVSEHILLEINSFAKPFPFSSHYIQSLVTEFLVKIGNDNLIERFNLEPFELNVLDVERTVAEKIMALAKTASIDRHEIRLSQLENKIRHLYDLIQISQNEHYQLIFESDLLLMLLKEVKNNDEQRAPGDKRWLDTSFKQIELFSNPNEYWSFVDKFLNGNFTQLVYGQPIKKETFIDVVNKIYLLLCKI